MHRRRRAEPLQLGTPYHWDNRYWYTGTFAWWGNTTYRRADVPGPTSDTGWSLKFFE
ncbi:hypothetical protein AB0K14_29195 [Actinosynnema sp. NPDC050801]|uniref:hypothetical protein n=1 Tax=unclassified Actinosynnema TaxID=2637065 RepID=UPI0033FD7D22